MNLTQLRQPEDVRVSVDADTLDTVILHRLGLTMANHISGDVDTLEITLCVSVTIDDVQYECRDIEVYLDDNLRPKVVIGHVSTSDEQTARQLFFGIQENEQHDTWDASSLVVKIEGETDEECDEALEDYLRLKLSERLALLGL